MSFAGETPSVEWMMELEEEGLGDELSGDPENDPRSVGVSFNFTILQKDVGRKVICVGKHDHWNTTFEERYTRARSLGSERVMERWLFRYS